jgi:hypothetical protein
MRSQGFSESREAKGRTKASTQSIRLPPGVSVSMARSKSPHQTPNFLVSGLKNFILLRALKLLTLMKKYLVLIATVSLVLGACERHPASQLPTEGEGVAKEGSGATQEKQTTPEPSPSGTPKTYFPQNS